MLSLACKAQPIRGVQVRLNLLLGRPSEAKLDCDFRLTLHQTPITQQQTHQSAHQAAVLPLTGQTLLAHRQTW